MIDLYRLTIAIFLFSSAHLYSQTPDLIYGAHLSGYANSEAYSVEVDNQGNAYVTGYFAGIVDFDPSPDSFYVEANGNQAFITKFDPTGNLLWAYPYGAFSGNELKMDPEGDLLITGRFSWIDNDLDPGPGVVSFSQGSNYILKLDDEANFLWAGAFSFDISGMTVDKSGNTLICGHFEGTRDFDPGPGIHNMTDFGYGDMYILKLDTGGHFLWAKQIGGIYGELAYDITTDNSHNIYLTGDFGDSTDLDPGPGKFFIDALGSDPFVLKLTPEGDFIWARGFYGNASDYGQNIQVDAQGNVYTTGRFIYDLDLDPGPATFVLNTVGDPTMPDIFFSKLDAMGNFVSGGFFGGMGYEYLNELKIDERGHIYVTGTFGDQMDADPGFGTYNLTAKGPRDVFVSKIDSAGNFAWAYQLSGTELSVGWDIAPDAHGNVTTVGAFEEQCDLDHGPDTLLATVPGWSNDNYNIFIHKSGYISGLNSKNTSIGELSLFPNPSNGNIRLDLPPALLPGRLEIRTLEGRSVQDFRIDTMSDASLEIPNSPGLYIAIYRSEDGKILRTKLIIE